MTNTEKFYEDLKQDEFYTYLCDLKDMFRNEVIYDYKCNRMGTCINSYNNVRYETILAICDNYLYYMEKKHNIGRGKE